MLPVLTLYKNDNDMTLEYLQEQLNNSLDHFVSLGEVLNVSYSKLWPTERGMLMYSLLMAGRRLGSLMAEAHRLQEKFITDVTGLELIEARGRLMNLMSYLDQGECDLDIAYSPSEHSEPIFDPGEIVSEENLGNLFPAKEQSRDYVNARRLLIESSRINYAELDECIKKVNGRIDDLLADAKSLKRNKEQRVARYEAMENHYMKTLWREDREQLIVRVRGELQDEDNKGKDEMQIMQALHQDILSEYTVGNDNKTLALINMNRSDKEACAKLMAEGRDSLSCYDMMDHFRFRESDKLLANHMNSRNLLMPCEEYQGKLFCNKAAYEFAKLIHCAIAAYVGFDKKLNAAFLFAAMRDLGLIFDEENNATLMADFIKDEYGEDTSADTITKPLRKCAGKKFCMLDENNTRDFTTKEMEKYKDPYWRCFSIINKVLDIGDLECADYLRELHPTIAANDVFDELDENDKKRLYFLASVLRGETLIT